MSYCVTMATVFFDKSIPATNSYAVSDSVLSAFDTDPMLARWGFKPVSIFNMIIAATALSLSVYTIVQNSAATHHKMLSGGWILGQTFEYLRLCEQHNPYAHCQQTVTNADFKRLDPILDALLEMPVDWPLETPATLANSATWHNPTPRSFLSWKPSTCIITTNQSHLRSKSAPRLSISLQW